MKKLNNKGVTLVELIVSFAIVGVAILYFFQTLYTVKTIYKNAMDETKEFVAKDYGLRLSSEYLKNNLEKTNDYLKIDFDESTILEMNSMGSCGDKKKVTTNYYVFDDSSYKFLNYKILVCY